MSLHRAAAFTLLVALGAPRFDLDVAIPPGSPADWGRIVPVTGIPSGSVFTPPIRRANEGTSATPAASALPVRMPTGSDLLRIVTVDLVVEIPWVQENEFPRIRPIALKNGKGSVLPPVDRALYWSGLAPLLRVLLHPGQVSREETLALLLEMGEGAIPALEAAATEPALSADALRILAAIGPPPTEAAVPPPAATSQERMMNRLVFEELARAHPFDRTSGFAQRLLLLGDEAVLPSVRACLDAPQPFLRRNAVSALARLHSREATQLLLDIACKSPDPVARIRAIAAIGRDRRSVDAATLAARLALSESREETVALIQAIGSLGDERALPAVLDAVAKRAVPDVVMAALIAVAKTPATDRSGRLKTWVASIEQRIRAHPEQWRVESTHFQADIPDTSKTRPELLEQLCLLAWLRLRPDDRSRATELVQLLPPSRNSGAARGRGAYANTTLGAVRPACQFLFLDLVRILGEEGFAILRGVVRDTTADPALRGYALQRLPGNEPAEIAREIAGDSSMPEGLRIHALELLAFVGDAFAAPSARGVLKEIGKRAASPLDPGAELLAVAALSILGERHKLIASELLEIVAARRAFSPPGEDRLTRLGREIDALIQAATSGIRGEELKKRIRALVEEAYSPKAGPNPVSRQKDDLVKFIEGQLAGLAQFGHDARYRQTVADAILRKLPGLTLGSDPNQLDFRGRVPLDEVLLLELGRTASADAIDLLTTTAATATPSMRAIACLGLGLSGKRDAEKALLARLGDDDGWVRFCAWLSLRHSTGQNFSADWLAGDVDERTRASGSYARWLVGQR